MPSTQHRRQLNPLSSVKLLNKKLLKADRAFLSNIDEFTGLCQVMFGFNVFVDINRLKVYRIN